MTALDADIAILGCGIVGSYLAARLADAGQRVVVVDVARGPGQLPAEATPVVRARERPHAGIIDARHHELGGNSAYWGGAMLRVPEADTGNVFDTPELSAAAIARGYERVESALGFPHAPRRDPWSDGEGISSAEALVLPASAKHMFASRLAPRLDKVVTCFDTRIETLDCSGGRLHAVGLKATDGTSTVLRARHYVACMGVVDSNLFARRFATQLFGRAPDALGRYLHDHVSIPLFRVNATTKSEFLRAFPPRFIGDFMSVRRFEFDAGPGGGGWSPRAFLHFVFDFDNVPLYADLKRLLAIRQASNGSARMIGAGFSLLRHGPELVQIGVKRFLGKRLHVGTEVPVTAVLDFETFPHPDNRICLDEDDADGAVSMYWNLRDQDVDGFARLVPVAVRLVNALAKRYGFSASPASSHDPAAHRAYLLSEGRDILHLGGGIPPGRGLGRAVLRPDLTFPAAVNVALVSTASLARASVVNPTHTLLAMAETIAERLVTGRTAAGSR